MRSLRILVRAALLLAIIVAAGFFEFYSFTQHTCLECRATRTERRILGIPFRHITYDAYSTSVIAHDPSHQHHWKWWGSIHTMNSFVCGRQHPIWQIPISVQAKYSQLVPASELRLALEAIDSPDRKTADAAINRVYERVTDSQ